jgi:hypothetical protein
MLLSVDVRSVMVSNCIICHKTVFVVSFGLTRLNVGKLIVIPKSKISVYAQSISMEVYFYQANSKLLIHTLLCYIRETCKSYLPEASRFCAIIVVRG